MTEQSDEQSAEEIRKNIYQSGIPLVPSVSHDIYTTNGQFTFVKTPISPIKTSGFGLTYNKVTGKPNISFAGRRNTKGGGKS